MGWADKQKCVWLPAIRWVRVIGLDGLTRADWQACWWLAGWWIRVRVWHCFPAYCPHSFNTVMWTSLLAVYFFPCPPVFLSVPQRSLSLCLSLCLSLSVSIPHPLLPFVPLSIFLSHFCLKWFGLSSVRLSPCRLEDPNLSQPLSWNTGSLIQITLNPPLMLLFTENQHRH